MAATDADGLADALEAALAGAIAPPVRVEDLRRLTGGASRETWGFDAVDADGVRHPLILRRDFPGGGTQNPDALAGCEDALDRAGEYALLERLYAAGLPVPRPVVLGDGEHGLDQSFVMERLEGEGRPKAIVHGPDLAQARERLPAELGALLARIHALGPDELPTLPRRAARAQLDVLETLLDGAAAPRPALELALRWCRENAPGEAELRLVHGDFRVSNFLVVGDHLGGVFDWEFSHLGEPLADLAYLCMRAWRFGADEREVSGLGGRGELYRAYEAAGGPAIDPDAVHYWEVLCHVKAAAVFARRGADHVNGVQRSVEAAAVGRRVAELEYDLLGLL